MYKLEIKFIFSKKKYIDIVNAIRVNFLKNALFFDVLYNYRKGLIQDCKFNEKEFLKALDKFPDNIVLKEIKGESGEYSNMISIRNIQTTNKFLNNFSIELYHTNIMDIIDSEVLKTILSDDDLIYCYCYNSDDSWEQSTKNLITLESININNNITKEEDIDIQDNFGKRVQVKGYSFIAAPLMWFGPLYNDVINFTKLENLKGSSIKSISNNKNIHLNLFPILESPEKYRSIQKKYWDFINENNIISKFEENTKINIFDYLKKNL